MLCINKNHFIPSNQKDLSEEAIEDLISSHLQYYTRLCKCSNYDNGRIISCDYIARITDDQFVLQNVLDALLEYNKYKTKEKIIYLQGLTLTGFVTTSQNTMSARMGLGIYSLLVLEVEVINLKY